MLEILEEKLLKLPSDVRERVTTHRADMTNFSLDKTFKLVILPVTSISLLIELEQFRSLFKCVYDHMESGGRFIFDYRTPDSILQNPSRNMPHCLTWDHGENNKEFSLCSEFVDEFSSRFYINFYTEQIEDGTTKRFFASSEKKVIYDDVIDVAIAENFTLLDSFTEELSPNAKIKFVILEKP